ncbi:MAG: DUF1343 domain-containing protein [Flavobacteriia bacterium]|nr:DUF1343 domain-containing protein [Flavobacteriia bacterium]
MKCSNDNILFFRALRYIKLLSLKSILLFLIASCSLLAGSETKKIENTSTKPKQEITIIEEPIEEIRPEEAKQVVYHEPIVGAERLNLYIDSLKGKRVAIVSNQTSVVGKTHLVDTLLSKGVIIAKVFAPEHGFRGDMDAGEKVNSSIDEKTGIPIISLYGKNKKPYPDQLEDVDIVIYDIQDVGVRFYTYISTLHYVMEACAENHKRLLVLDRPNPNGHYIDGPVRDNAHKSFVGMDPVPIVYGMTIGEYALMVNGERWMSDSLQCSLWIVPCKYYVHKTKYILPVAPSPNLRTEIAVTLYPSLCLFEATSISIGRGTERPFEMFGHPLFPKTDYTFTPIPSYGAKSPLWENRVCNGFDLQHSQKRRTYEINLGWIIQAKLLLGDTVEFINQTDFFNRLAGNSALRQQILAGKTAKEIRESWKPDLDNFKKIRAKYLLYK